MERLTNQEVKAIDSGKISVKIFGRKEMLFSFLFTAIFLWGIAIALFLIIVNQFGFSAEALPVILFSVVFSGAIFAFGLVFFIKAIPKIIDKRRVKLIFLTGGLIFRKDSGFIFIRQEELESFSVEAEILKYRSRGRRRMEVPLDDGFVTLTVGGEKSKISCGNLEKTEFLLNVFKAGGNVEYESKSFKRSSSTVFIQNAGTFSAIGILLTVFTVVAFIFNQTLGSIVMIADIVIMVGGVLWVVIRFSLNAQKEATKKLKNKIDRQEDAVSRPDYSFEKTEIMRKKDNLTVLNVMPGFKDMTDEELETADSNEKVFIKRLRSEVKALIFPFIIALIFVIGPTLLIVFVGIGVLIFAIFAYGIGGLIIFGFLYQIFLLTVFNSIVKNGHYDQAEYVSTQKRGGKACISVSFRDIHNRTIIKKTPYIYTDMEVVNIAEAKTVKIKRKGNRFFIYLPHQNIA